MKKILITAFLMILNLSCFANSKPPIKQENTFQEPRQVISLTQDNYDAIMSASCPVIIDAYTTWCPPCKRLAPIFAQLNEELGDHYLFVKLNAEEQPELAGKLNVKAYPSIFFIKNGSEMGKEVGCMSKEKFKEKILQYFGC